MSSKENRNNKNYTFEIKFGPYHQKVTITMSPLSLTMNTLREVAIRFIETMVSLLNKNIQKKKQQNNFFLLKCPDQDIKYLNNRILLFRYEPSSYSMIIPLKPRDILVPDTIVEVIISRKFVIVYKYIVYIIFSCDVFL
jgi:hypothetical protein